MEMSGDGMHSFDLSSGQSIDDMVSQNERAIRRRSMPVYGQGSNQMGSSDSRRMSVMSFGDPFQFNLQTGADLNGIMHDDSSYPRTSRDTQNNRQPAADLSINTELTNHNSRYSAIPGSGSTYASPMHPSVSMDMDMDMTSPYPNNMTMPLDMHEPLGIVPSDMNMFSNSQYTNSMMNSPASPEFVCPQPALPSDPNNAGLQAPDQFRNTSLSTTPDQRSSKPTRTNSRDQSSTPSTSQPHSENPPSSKNVPTPMSLRAQEGGAQPPQQEISAEALGQIKFPWRTPPGGFPSTMHSKPHMNTQFKNAYSSTGFDMLGVLMRVAARPDPVIDIGSVDLSCAFVVCDAQMDDNPIVYCSENFERLTGYSKHMILGRNCRFLQSPDGKVEPGTPRKYVDDSSVQYLKSMINTKSEAQISLINYRRGGQPFMNLLTMIPITWDSDREVKFYVGFQVDLVEQPSSMTNKNADGSYRVNYQRGLSMPSYIFNDALRPQPEQGQTISNDEVSNVLASYGSTGDSEITRRLWDKVLLENTDDVVHVLSLKGLFLYLSPSSNRILEYDPSELVGTALSSVCHPSDIVPVTRELKETNNGNSVNVVFRIRRKKSGYMWFEGHGSLHTEQGKGRKCIILVGRERPVYTLSKAIVRESGGIGDNELWTKMSTSGMFLFVSSNVRQLLDRQPEDLVGTSIQALMRQDSKPNFGRILELTRTGRKGEVKHEMINKRGQVLQAFTTLYPGDATEGQKPTFIVGQTRLLRFSRSGSTQRPAMYTSKDRTSGESNASIPSTHSEASPAHQGNFSGFDSPHTNTSESHFHTTDASAATFAGQNGLAIGHQDLSLASDDNVFDELKTTRSTSWQYELRQMEKRNRYLAEEVQSLLAAKKKRKRRKGAGQLQKDCANCHTRTTPEWRRGPSGNRDLCNSCGLRWAKQNGRVSPRHSSQQSQSDRSKQSASPRHNQTILPNEQKAQAGPALIHGEKRTPQQANTDNHAAKVARMEAAAPQGYSGGIPTKIDEAIEPD